VASDAVDGDEAGEQDPAGEQDDPAGRCSVCGAQMAADTLFFHLTLEHPDVMAMAEDGDIEVIEFLNAADLDEG
jgi:hypothetical protein